MHCLHFAFWFQYLYSECCWFLYTVALHFLQWLLLKASELIASSGERNGCAGWNVSGIECAATTSAVVSCCQFTSRFYIAKTEDIRKADEWGYTDCLIRTCFLCNNNNAFRAPFFYSKFVALETSLDIIQFIRGRSLQVCSLQAVRRQQLKADMFHLSGVCTVGEGTNLQRTVQRSAARPGFGGGPMSTQWHDMAWTHLEYVRFRYVSMVGVTKGYEEEEGARKTCHEGRRVAELLSPVQPGCGAPMTAELDRLLLMHLETKRRHERRPRVKKHVTGIGFCHHCVSFCWSVIARSSGQVWSCKIYALQPLERKLIDKIRYTVYFHCLCKMIGHQKVFTDTCRMNARHQDSTTYYTVVNSNYIVYLCYHCCIWYVYIMCSRDLLPPSPGMLMVWRMVCLEGLSHREMWSPAPCVGGEGCVLSNVQLFVNITSVCKTWIKLIVSTSPCWWGGGFLFSVCI